MANRASSRWQAAAALKAFDLAKARSSPVLVPFAGVANALAGVSGLAHLLQMHAFLSQLRKIIPPHFKKAGELNDLPDSRRLHFAAPETPVSSHPARAYLGAGARQVPSLGFELAQTE